MAALSALLMLVTSTPSSGQIQVDDEADDHGHLPDVDTRAVTVSPTTGQLAAVDELGATARWTRFGTAQSLIRHGDFLAEGVRGADAAAAAIAWLDDNRALYRLDSVDDLEVHADIALADDAHVVVLRQRIGGLLVSPEGLASIGLVGSPDGGWNVAYASSTFVADDAPTRRLSLSEGLSTREAFTRAAEDVGADVDAGDVTMDGTQEGWRVLDVATLDEEQHARRVAFPTPGGGFREAFETVYVDDDATEGYRSFVDVETGAVLYRESIADHADDPTWEVYPATPRLTPLGNPPWNFPSADTRDVWCWLLVPGCKLRVENDAARVPWDTDAETGDPTFTTIGNATRAHEAWNNEFFDGYRPTAPDRQYRFPFENRWYESGCDPDNLGPGGNDIDASVANLFAGNWRMHNWSYNLGFTEETWNGQEFNFGEGTAEEDPVIARAQAGAISPGSRDNATMLTRPDGLTSFMSMFLWQPIASAFYSPCVVGDFDMSVIGHEYTHFIENRMIGKGATRSGFHAGAMGESWSDFFAMEYLNQYGFLPMGGEDPWAVGPYVTGNPTRGIRNLNMSYPSAGQFPQAGREVRVGGLGFGSMGYDIVGPQVHADSEIWSATNIDIRSLFLSRYPGQGQNLQRACADGLRDAGECPGNRRWIQLVVDAFLLMPTNPTMLDARDAYFAADQMRFGGANQDLLWLGFARRGFGEDATVTGTQDTNPVPSYASPHHDEATLRFEAVAKDDGGQPVDADVYVGHYEARATPLQDVERFVPNPQGYDFVARADGYGHVRFHVRNLRPGEERTVRIHFPTNVASQSQGASASGDGARHDDLIDDTEATNWESTTETVQGRQVTIALDGERSFRQAKASALLAPGQNRFTALRQFELYACTEGNRTNPDCDDSTDRGWNRILRSQRDAFPGVPPRPTGPDLLLRTWQVPITTATHVKFVVLDNQCTGNPNFQGEQDNDPGNVTDCRLTPVGANQVRAAELQLLTSTPRVDGATTVD